MRTLAGIKIHRAWFVLIGMMLIYAGMIGVLVNCTGVLFAAIIQDMKFRVGDLSIYYLIRTLSSAATVHFTAKAFMKGNAKYVMALLGLLSSLSMLSMCFFHQLWQWYLAAAAMGIGMSCCMVVVPVVLHNWFYTRKGMVVGVTMSASGIVAALFSPICSALIAALGWRLTCIVMSLLGIIMIILPSLFLLEIEPERVGYEAYGKKLAEKDGKKEARISVKAGGAEKENTPKEAEAPNYIFFFTLCSIVLTGSLAQFNNQLPVFAQSVGYSIGIGAALTSCSMLGNVAGKLSLGILRDRVGIYKAVKIFQTLLGASMLIFLFGAKMQWLLYLGTAFYGTVYSMGATAPSLLLLDLYGPERYREKFSRMQAGSGFISAFLSLGFPYIYDLTGSFSAVFLYGLAACVVSYAIYCALGRYSEKRKISLPESAISEADAHAV